MTYYYIKDFAKDESEQIIFVDTDRQRLETTLTFTPDYKDAVILESEDDPLADVKAAQERERIQNLFMTKLDFAQALQGLGIGYAQLKTLLESNEQALMSWELCNNVYRNNPLLEQLGAALNVTPEQLDELFKRVDEAKEITNEKK
jgi:hypothetical protein